MSDPQDTQRLIGDVVRYGTIASVDHARAKCTVQVGDLTTGPINWLAGRAGDAASFSAPSAGEQVILLSPEGDTAAAIALLGVYSGHNPAPGAREHLHVTKYEDGSVFSYDAAAQHLSVELVDGATAEIAATGGLTITGDVTIKGKLAVSDDVAVAGKIDADGDVTGQGTSLHGHKHKLVKTGTDISGVPA